MKKISIFFIGTIAIIAIVILGWSSVRPTPTPQSQQDAITLGFTSPLSGDAVVWGTGVLNGAMIALDRVNQEGGINGRMLKLSVEDSQCDGKQASLAIQKLIPSLEVPFVVGPLCSSEVLAMAPITESHNVVLLSSAASSPMLKDAGEYIFSIYPLDNYEATLAASYAFEQLNKRSAAIIYAQNDYGEGGKEVLHKAFTQSGGSVVYEYGYTLGETDFRTPLTQVSERGADVILVWGQPAEMVSLLKQKNELGNHIQLISSTSNIEDNSILRDAGVNLADGVIYTKFTSVNNENFQYLDTVYQRQYNKHSDMFAALGYDVVMLAAQTLRISPNYSADSIRQALLDIYNFPGASGNMSFDENGMVVKDFTIKTVRNGEFVEVE